MLIIIRTQNIKENSRLQAMGGFLLIIIRAALGEHSYPSWRTFVPQGRETLINTALSRSRNQVYNQVTIRNQSIYQSERKNLSVTIFVKNY